MFIRFMTTINCKKCGHLITLDTPYDNVMNMGVTCFNCKSVNNITMENGQLKSQELDLFGNL